MPTTEHKDILSFFRLVSFVVDVSSLFLFIMDITKFIFTEKEDVLTTSIQIAEYFNKRHGDVIRAIENRSFSKSFTERNFALSEYKDKSGRKNKMYILTKMGFTTIAFKMQGKKSDSFIEDYVIEFERKEKELELAKSLMSNKQLEQLEVLKKENGLLSDRLNSVVDENQQLQTFSKYFNRGYND